MAAKTKDDELTPEQLAAEAAAKAAAEAAAAEAAKKAKAVGAVNTMLKAQAKEREQKELPFGPYKAEHVMEIKTRGDKTNVIMTDHRKFTVELG